MIEADIQVCEGHKACVRARRRWVSIGLNWGGREPTSEKGKSLELRQRRDTMQERVRPYWYAKLSQSNEDLLREDLCKGPRGFAEIIDHPAKF